MWRVTNWYWVFTSVSTRSRYWVFISVLTCGIYQCHSYCISQTCFEAMPDLRKWGRVMVLLCWEQWERLDHQYTNCYQRLLWSWPPLLSSSYSTPILPLSLLSPPPFYFPLPSSSPLSSSLKALGWHWYNLDYPSLYQSQHSSSANHQGDLICNLLELKPEFLELSKKASKINTNRLELHLMKTRNLSVLSDVLRLRPNSYLLCPF